MHEVNLIATLAGGLTAALNLWYVAQRLGLSPIVGYLLTGIAVGPATPGHVANRESAALSVLDPNKIEVVGRIDTGQGPARVVITPDGTKIAFPLFHEDAVQIADTARKAVTHTIAVGKQPAGTTMSADGELLFVSCENEKRVYVIAVADGTVLTTISTGEGPGAMASLDLMELG